MKSKSILVKEPIPNVIENIAEWPIYRLSQDKESFLKEVIQRTKADILNEFAGEGILHNELKNVLYQEKNRLTKEPWKADSAEERTFWSEIKRRILVSAKEEKTELRSKLDHKILNTILRHYADEIVANFDPKTYRIAKKILPWVFSRLMNASPGNRFKFLWSSRKSIYEKLKIMGPVDHIRKLAKLGTLVVVPTHFSNLDSPTIGFSLDTIGLPAMTYGAGLNLFTIGVLSRFMNDLGAYKLDRRKKNKFYLQLLKNYSTVALERGAHSLFFPGGTRSRSGAIESKLKLGLLGTAVEAQRQNLLKFPEQTAPKIFVVPVVINYHFVMEAPRLIQQWLAYKGKEQFIDERTDFSTSYRIIQLLYKFLTATPGITISLASPTDVFGNEVDENGESFNKIGQRVHIKDFYSRNGKITEDKQRDEVYTTMLGDEIVKKFRKYNVVLSSHIVAFVAFSLIKRENKRLDLYELLRIPSDEIQIHFDAFLMEVENIRAHLIEMEKQGDVLLSPQIKSDVYHLIEHGLKNLGVYHPSLPLLKGQDGYLTTQDLPVLYFYHNRLHGYGLEKLFA